MTSPKECPSCGKISPASAVWCQCGWKFQSEVATVSSAQEGQAMRAVDLPPCPHCGAVRLAGAERCDCGWVFAAGFLGPSAKARELAQQPEERKRSNSGAIAGVAGVLGIICVIVLRALRLTDASFALVAPFVLVVWLGTLAVRLLADLD